MFFMKSEEQSTEYFCPGEKHPITRAVHLGRLASFYFACAQCPHRNETGGLSPRQVRLLEETAAWRNKTPSLFHDEGAGGVFNNDFRAIDAQHIAAAFGVLVSSPEIVNVKPTKAAAHTTTAIALPKISSGNCIHRSCNETAPTSRSPHVDHATHTGRTTHTNQTMHIGQTIVLAGDGRPITAELLAAASEGLRWAGCDVVDIGPATAACLAFTMTQLQAAGGLLVGNPGSEPHTVGLKFWLADALPLSIGGSLERLITLHQKGVDRPTRVFGTLQRRNTESLYLDMQANHYHGLRPLRFVVNSASIPFTKYLKHLAASTACSILPNRSTRDEFPSQVRDDKAHFAVCVDGDGETCRVFDDLGRPASNEALMSLLMRHLLAETANANQNPQAATEKSPPRTIVIEQDASPTMKFKSFVERLSQHGVRVVASSARRAEMAAAMRKHAALFAGGPSGRFWYAADKTIEMPCDAATDSIATPWNVAAQNTAAQAGPPLLDALMTVTRLLQVLSRDDAPLSALLDHESDCE
jgi:phosphomannomutase